MVRKEKHAPYQEQVRGWHTVVTDNNSGSWDILSECILKRVGAKLTAYHYILYSQKLSKSKHRQQNNTGMCKLRWYFATDLEFTLASVWGVKVSKSWGLASPFLSCDNKLNSWWERILRDTGRRWNTQVHKSKQI